MRLLVSSLVVLAVGALPAVATGAPLALSLRGGAVFEGPQHTLERGFVAGATAEAVRRLGAVGVALEWASDPGGDGGRESANALHLGAFARLEPGERKVRPFLEAGLGVTRLGWEGGAGPLEVSGSSIGAGCWIGGGLSLPVSGGVRARLDGRYSAVVLEAPGAIDGGGDLGDYFTVAVSLAFAR